MGALDGGRRPPGRAEASYGHSTEAGNGWYTTFAAASVRR